MSPIFLDTDILIDVFAKREPFYHDSAQVLTLVEEQHSTLLFRKFILCRISEDYHGLDREQKLPRIDFTNLSRQGKEVRKAARMPNKAMHVTSARCRQFPHTPLAYWFVATLWSVARREERAKAT